MRAALRQVGADVPPAAGTEYSSLDALNTLFEQAGLNEIALTSFDVSVAFRDFGERQFHYRDDGVVGKGGAMYLPTKIQVGPSRRSSY